MQIPSSFKNNNYLNRNERRGKGEGRKLQWETGASENVFAIRSYRYVKLSDALSIRSDHYVNPVSGASQIRWDSKRGRLTCHSNLLTCYSAFNSFALHSIVSDYTACVGINNAETSPLCKQYVSKFRSMEKREGRELIRSKLCRQLKLRRGNDLKWAADRSCRIIGRAKWKPLVRKAMPRWVVHEA